MDLGGEGRGKGMMGSPIQMPQILAMKQNLKPTSLRGADMAAEMNTAAAMVWRDANFNGPTGFLMSVLPQTKWAN